MAKNMNYSDASNTSVRAFLTQAGIEFDKSNDLESLNGKKGYDLHRLKAFEFQNSCCFYCDVKLDENVKKDRDHVIPMNKDFAGIHCWGNVVYCCSDCNSDKHYYRDGDWKDYLQYKGKMSSYNKWVQKYPNGQSESIKLVDSCKDIYEHVGNYIRKKVEDI